MTKHWTLTAAALLLAASPWTVAQTTLSAQTAAAIASNAPPLEQPTLTVREAEHGTRYIHGGAGDQERRQMSAQRSQFPLKVVLSAGSGEYIVADSFRLTDGKRGALLDAGNLGPWVMVNAPAGSYRLEVTYKGKTLTRTVKAGKSPTEVNLRFPG